MPASAKTPDIDGEEEPEHWGGRNRHKGEVGTGTKGRSEPAQRGGRNRSIGEAGTGTKGRSEPEYWESRRYFSGDREKARLIPWPHIPDRIMFYQVFQQ